MTILMIMAVILAHRLSLDLRLASFQLSAQEALYLARAGVEGAAARLNRDDSSEVDTLWQCGITLGTDSRESLVGLL